MSALGSLHLCPLHRAGGLARAGCKSDSSPCWRRAHQCNLWKIKRTDPELLCYSKAHQSDLLQNPLIWCFLKLRKWWAYSGAFPSCELSLESDTEFINWNLFFPSLSSELNANLSNLCTKLKSRSGTLFFHFPCFYSFLAISPSSPFPVPFPFSFSGWGPQDKDKG